MEACSFLLLRRDGTSGEVCADTRFPAGALFVAPIPPKVHGKTDRATAIMTRDGMVRAGIGGVAMVIMAVHIVEQTADRLAQGVIKDQGAVSLWTAYRLSLLEQLGEPTVIDLVLAPRCVGEEAGEISFVSAVKHTAGDIGQTFVVQDDQAGQGMLEMAKLAPILKEITKDVRVGGHNGSGSDDGKLHEPGALSSRGRYRA
jgi:hypothetical protein